VIHGHLDNQNEELEGNQNRSRRMVQIMMKTEITGKE
jgi:hypothetical protein